MLRSSPELSADLLRYLECSVVLSSTCMAGCRGCMMLCSNFCGVPSSSANGKRSRDVPDDPMSRTSLASRFNHHHFSPNPRYQIAGHGGRHLYHPSAIISSVICRGCKGKLPHMPLGQAFCNVEVGACFTAGNGKSVLLLESLKTRDQPSRSEWWTFMLPRADLAPEES